MSAKARWIAAGLALLAAVAAGLWFFLTSLDHVVKAAIEHYGPRIAGVPVTVESVALSARDGRGVVRGLSVGVPAGYASPRTLGVAENVVAVDPATLAGEVVTIRDILVQSPQVAYELRGGTNNLEAIQRHIEEVTRKAPGAAGEGGGEAAGSKRRYRIDRITLRGARVTLRGPVKGEIAFDLPDVEVAGLGSDGRGVTAAEAARAVNGALTARIAQKVLTNAELLRRGGLQGARDALRGLINR